jgi:hypothetical protein
MPARAGEAKRTRRRRRSLGRRLGNDFRFWMIDLTA